LETTQAQAPAPAQAQTPVHPIHEETATLNALTNWVSSTPDNDPHQGTDLELPKQTKSETPAEEPKVEAEAKSDEEQVEFDEDAQIFDVPDLEDPKKTVKASFKELREQRLMKADYMRNIQKVKAQEAELSTKAQQAEVQAAQQYAERISLHQQAIQRLASVKSMAEIEALSKDDPAAAQSEFLKLINVNQTMQALEAEKQAALGKQQQAMQTARVKAIEQARQTLESDIPGWNVEAYNKVLGGVVSNYGFKKEEVEQVIDARLIKVFHDAYQYGQLQKAKPEISKRVVAVPKVVKPGSAEKPTPAKEAVSEAMQRAKKTGRMDDAVAAYLAMQKQK
jgi:hypothetical protein